MAHSLSCQFCSKMMLMFLDDTHDRYFEDWKLSEVIEMPCQHASSIRRLWERGLATHGQADGDFEKGSFLGWTVRVNDLFHSVALWFYLDGFYKFFFYIKLVSRPDKPTRHATHRVLNRQWVDFRVPRAWYAECIKEHGQECHRPWWMRLRMEPVARPEWLVDVVDNCVVPCVSDKARYIALSYTWGRVECLKHTSQTLDRLRRRGALHPDQTPDIPRTVRDAFGITKLLGERYLWVDSLCIDQGATTTSKDLNSMHRIYANSAVCLIALAGTDANHGLRGIQGVSAPRNVQQDIYEIADGERVSTLVLPYEQKSIDKHSAIQGSSYTERGWTYQENAFAMRRLVFTDRLLRWTCECGKWDEETVGPTDVDEARGQLGLSTFWVTKPGPDLALIQEAANDFNTRYFTNEGDTLKAFLGVQNHISRDFLGGLNYGHPEIFFDISLLWRARSRTRSVSKRRLGRTADSCLPSWSWMGWQGEFEFDVDHEFLISERRQAVGFTQSVALWYKMQFPSAPALERQTVNCRWQVYRMAVDNGSVRAPFGWEKFTLNGDISKFRYRRSSTYKGTSVNEKSTFSHIGLRSAHCKYPIPLPSYTEAARSIEQCPFVFARTARSFFTAKKLVQSDLRPTDDVRKLPYPLGLFCQDGKCAGLLRLQNASDETCFQVEVVAVVKGWTRALSEYFSAFQEQEYPMSSLSRDPYAGIVVSQWRSYDCYFVLCVKWENGVAKRQGTGMVEAEIWERNKEPVDLILG